MSSRRPPRTSYGYLAPPGARVRGWECRNDGCGTGDEPAPRRWPHPCRLCGQPTDPVFEGFWAHEAEGYRLRHNLTSTDELDRAIAEIRLPVWAYKDAHLRGDSTAAERAWQAFRQTKRRRQERGDGWLVTSARYEIAHWATAFDDIDRAAQEALEWYPSVDTRGVEEDNERRTEARTFVSLCIRILQREASIDHPLEAAIDAAMRDVAARAESVLNPDHQKGFWRIGELRARHRSRATITEARWSPVGLRGALPAVGVTAADAALAAMETHDDTDVLDALVRRLEQDGSLPSLLHLLQARRHVAGGDVAAALSELDQAAHAADRLAPRLRPQVHATYGTLRALGDLESPGALDEGIRACRAGRQYGRRWWRQITAADTSLARLLLWRALRTGTPPAQRDADVREAVRLARRRCRPWHRPGAEERLVLHDALAARDALTGEKTTEQRRRAWRRAVDAPATIAERARLATAWVAWAVGTGDVKLAAEAYQYLVALVPLDAAARYGPSAKQRVLAAAQEHTEEAGYWLSRAWRYREAVVALETGRAVGLSEALGGVIAEDAHGDPSALQLSYQDIIATTGDGALVYLAAAKAGGYALVVAANHDPQFVELPKLDRATVAAMVSSLLPGTGDRGPAPTRDAAPARSGTDPLAMILKTLWNSALRDLLLHSARGRVVTLIPVGLLSLLPLHAAGEPGTPGDEYTEWRHAGHFSAIRYAPNARSLHRCRAAAGALAAGPHRLLAVDVPDGSGIGPGGHLHHVKRETAEVVRRWAGQAATAPDCTWQEFRDSADDYTVWHLACHGSAEPHSILDSRLYFADQDVTLRDLRRALRPGRRRLAVLSACESNLTDASLPNEVVGLPSALLQVGFAGVIASSWKVDDLATAYLMTAFYHWWCQEGYEPVVALNIAQRWLRSATRADLAAVLPGVSPGGVGEHPYLDPRYWAAFAYTGA